MTFPPPQAPELPPLPRWELTPGSLLERTAAGGFVSYPDHIKAVKACYALAQAEIGRLKGDAGRERLEQMVIGWRADYHKMQERAEKAERERDELHAQLEALKSSTPRKPDA